MRFFLILHILISFVISQNLNSGFESNFDLEKIKDLNQENNFKNQNHYSSLTYDPNLLDEVVDPNKYIVGPGDSYSFNILSADGVVNSYLYVNPTGEVLIPSIGKVYVNKMTLKQSIYEIEKKCLEKYPNINVHILLNKIRQFKIQVKGIYDIPSYINASPILRVSDIIFPIINDYNLKKQNSEIDSPFYINKNKKLISRRNIKVLRNNDTIHVDLLAFNRFGNKSKNPTLMQGDIIELKFEENFINIYGGINLPGEYEIVENQNLLEIINIAGGFTKNADFNHIEINRFVDEKETIKILLNYDKIIDFILEDSDLINIRYIKDYKRQDIVTLEGEVKYPGTYTIKHQETTIKEILQKAGGLSSNADISKIEINNTVIDMLQDFEYDRINLIPEQYRSDEEKSYIKARAYSAMGGIKSHNLLSYEKILDFTINRNDLITIPQALDYIEVIGGVYNPGRYPFDEKLNLNKYVNLAGGYTKKAKYVKYIVKSNSGYRLKYNNKIKIEKGDIIFIPERIERSNWDKFKEGLTLLSQFATLLAIINSLSG